MNDQQPEQTGDQKKECPKSKLNRRTLLVGANALALAGLGGGLLWQNHESGMRENVFVNKVDSYDEDIKTKILEGLKEIGISTKKVRGKNIMLKPNLVEPNIQFPHVNTHPLFIRAVVEAFRSLDAADVFVAEGQGHIRDTYHVLEQSGLDKILKHEKIEFVDLNHDDIFEAENNFNESTLKNFYFPKTLKRADLIVSLPKMKTHHWAGVTLSMKNFFGVMPGICYGWPKNVLHHAGIIESIIDINAAVKPNLAIVDGIIGMEGDGPIMGTPKNAGVIIMGTNLPSVDATTTRLMGMDPWKVRYLRDSSGRLGPILEPNIEQRGETISSTAKVFQLLDHPSHSPYPS